MNTTPTAEDRIWAIISHLSSLAFGMGIILPVIGWADQRRKSNYASFQSLQALGYQSLGFTIWILLCLLVVVVASIILLIVPGPGGGNLEIVDPPVRTWIAIIFVVLSGLFALYFILPIIGIGACALGRDFRYPMLGDRLARYLGYGTIEKAEEQTWLREDREFRWVAAMGHFSILILLWGMLAPLTTWILFGKRSSFLKFQSIQTLLYQAITTVLYVVALSLYLFGFLLLLAVMGAIGEPDFNSMIGTVSIVVLGLSLLISFAIILLVPFLHILGQWAGYRILKGDDYRYPWVGRLVDRLVSKNPDIEEKLS